MSFNNLRVLVFMLDKRARYRQRMFSNIEVFCGPDCDTYKIGDTFISIKTPVGMFDIQGIINQLPSHQQPDLIVVKADSTKRIFPVNLKSTDCPKVLILGDTCSHFPPLRSLLAYATKEKFDFVCSDESRHHLHFFKDAGLNKVFWAPALNLNPQKQPFRLSRNPEVALIGNLGSFNPFRQSVINHLRKESIPALVDQQNLQDAAITYGKSQISLNCSLNGNLSSRVFEIISSGGFLVTDKLSLESGLYDLLDEGKHFKCYSSVKELGEIANYYLNNYRDAQTIAQEGLKHYEKTLTPEISLSNFYSCIFKNHLDEKFQIESRKDAKISRPDIDLKRVEIYEKFQALQLNNSLLNVALTEKAGDKIFDDIKDLVRISFHKSTEKGKVIDLLVIDELELAGFDFDTQFHSQPFMELKIISQNTVDYTSLGLRKSRFNSSLLELKNFEKITEALSTDLYEPFLLLRNKRENNASYLLKLAERFQTEGNVQKAAFYARQVLKDDRASIQALEILAKTDKGNLEDFNLIKGQWEFSPVYSCTPMKILLLSNLYPPQEFDGGGRLMADFSTVLREMGHDVYTLTSNSPQFGNVPINEPGVFRSLNLTGGWKDGRIFSLPQTRAHKIEEKNISTLRTHIRAFNPDVCLMGNLECLGNNILHEIINHQIPVVHLINSNLPGYSPQKQPVSKLYRLCCTSKWVQKSLYSQGYSTENSSVIYPGAAADFFNFSTKPNFNKLKIAFAGQIQPSKGVHLLINSLKELKSEGYEFTCEIAGITTDQIYMDQLKQFVQSQAMGEQISFTGFLNRHELRKLYGRCNTLVTPSIADEAFGISQIEAMAAGLCVISSRTGGSSEIVKDGYNGFKFDKDNNSSLTASLRMLIDDKGIAKSMARQGHEDALENFNIVHSTEKLVKELESLAALREPLILK